VEGEERFPNRTIPFEFPYRDSFQVSALEDRTPTEKLNASIVLLLIFFAVASVFGFVRSWLFTLAGQRVHIFSNSTLTALPFLPKSLFYSF